MWTSVVPVNIDDSAPSARSKHSATLIGENVYLLGGRNGNLPLKDFWKYNLISGKWQQLKPTGDKLPALQEHSAVSYKDRIYVFGGEVGFSAGTETALWCYDIKGNTWRKIRTKKGVATPKGRRGHSALVHKGAMLVYGGYQDLRGSSSELWAFHFETESWHLLSTTPKNSNAESFPPGRHKHSALIHDDCMWIYGGMTDLQEKGDFWKWDTLSKKWTIIKTKLNPGPLHSHAVCKLPSSMLLFGGERGGHPTNELWKFNFSIETWEKVLVSGSKPQPRSESIAFSVSELSLESPNSPDNKTVRYRPRTCFSADRGSRHSSYLPNNRVAPCEKTYVFQPSRTNYTDGSEANEEKPSRGILQEISKFSQMARNGKCSYTVLTGTDSTESLLKQNMVNNDEEECRGLVKSKSAYVIKRKTEERKHDGKITREPISVPNFSLLTLATPTLTPVEATKLVYLDTDEENEFLGEKIEPLPPPKRGESYSSHLGYADNPLYQHMMKMPERENVSSTSDYASIETVNRLSSNSNYSVKTHEENQKNRDKDGPFGFCNPHYMGPDIKALLTSEKKQFARFLTNEEAHTSEEDLLELQDYNGSIDRNTKVLYRSSLRNRPNNSALVSRPKDFKRRAQSAGRADRKDKISPEVEFDKVKDYVPLYVYVIGGKEHGQVTIFQRPISIWKLKLF